MKKILLKNCYAVLPAEKKQDASILIENGRIEILEYKGANLDGEIFDLAGATVLAGFVDIHNHGAFGVDVNGAGAEDLRRVSEYLASRGVTAWLPTLVPDAVENYRNTIAAIDELMEAQKKEEAEVSGAKKVGARVLGVHYEGVFANEKMCGALRPRFFRSFRNGNEADDLPRLKTMGAIHLTTLAPEIENGIELIKTLKKQNWTVSIGHTRADAATLSEALAAGASSVTHLFNAMSGVHHRDLGVAGWALTCDEISCEIIADGVHVAPPILRFAYKNKGAMRLALVSDSVAPTGLGDGEFRLWDENLSVVKGRTENERGSIAGSVITMLDAVKTMLSLGIELGEVSKMASLAPARILGMENVCGSIETGKRADLVALDDEGNVKLTTVGGTVVEGGRMTGEG